MESVESLVRGNRSDYLWPSKSVANIGTLVGRVGEKKRTPNPNVLLETGYAAHCMGWDRVILVMNTHKQFGPPEDLPFDLKNRRFPLTYTLGPDDDKVPVREQLITNLTDAIQDARNREHNAVERIVSQLSIECIDLLCRYGEREDGSAASKKPSFDAATE